MMPYKGKYQAYTEMDYLVLRQIISLRTMAGSLQSFLAPTWSRHSLVLVITTSSPTARAGSQTHNVCSYTLKVGLERPGSV